MREKLNSDPKTQVAAVAILIVLAAFFFISKSGGGEEEETASTEATVAVAGTEATGTSTGATPGEAVEGAVTEAVENASAETGATASGVPTTIDAPPALPEAVTAAYKADETVVLLIVRDGAVDDDLVEQASSTLSSMSEVALFVVPVSQISRYSSITIGAEVSRVPALVAVSPRRISGAAPKASVSYGFQTRQTLIQAVRDASYEGPAATYQPN
jgi:hypothetical protein